MAASRMAGTRSLERACCGLLREEICGRERSAMGRLRNANWKPEGSFILFRHPSTKRSRMTNTLTSAPVAPLLERLFPEAEKASAAWPARAAPLPAAELARLMHSKTDYIEFYSRLKPQPLPVSRETGALLYMLARHARAAASVQFGTPFA